MSHALKLNIKLLVPEAKPPTRAKSGDAGWDVVAIQDSVLAPGARMVCPLGLASEFSADFFALLHDRSSLGSRGLHCLAGVIDSSYRGEWKVVLLNTSSETHTIKKGDRICQCLFLPVPNVEIEIVSELTESDRGVGGFGSTGK